MRLQATFAALLALGAAACSGGQAKAPDSIDRMSKAEVESIVKEYLLREPEILFEMQTAYQTQPAGDPDARRRRRVGQADRVVEGRSLHRPQGRADHHRGIQRL